MKLQHARAMTRFLNRKLAYAQHAFNLTHSGAGAADVPVSINAQWIIDADKFAERDSKLPTVKEVRGSLKD